jgi:hypothetical protein
VPRPRYLTAATALATCLALVLSWAVPAFAAMSAAPAATSARAAGAGASGPPRQVKQTGTALPTKAVRPVAGGDEIVDGRGDSAGWHLYAASSGGGWAWQPLATLAPQGLDPEDGRWVGRQCLTGDGRYVVAVVAPWSASNSPAGNDRGGVAYVVDAHTGTVRLLVTGVSLYYFTPSCGPGSTVALTRYAGTDEQTTQLVLADAAHAAVRIIRRLAGQYTGAVPAPDGGFLAASGASIVHVPPSGSLTIRARTAGQPFDLTANAAGGADYLVGTGHSAASVWHLDSHGTRQVGAGTYSRLALFEGRAGHTVAAGTTRLDATAGITRLTQLTAPAETASLGGVVSSLLPGQPGGAPRASGATPTGALPRTPLLLGEAGRSVAWTPDSVAAPTVGLPPVLSDGGTLTPGAAPAGARSASSSASATFTSTCAVGRNDVYLQAMQPSPEDVDWAASLAGRSLLTGSAGRRAGFANLGMPAYSPSLDFPLPAPFGPGAGSIPREVLQGIFAQESNFIQASPHSVQGVAGNPLIADYYGAAGGYVTGVATPDCGYGLGQVTSGMHTGDMSYDLQRKVAVDYAENVAASAQILAQKWNQLTEAGITANNADPSVIENWYLAIWAYNSGLHTSTGSGPWGLGWANNPANPDYPYNRHPFLHLDTTAGYDITYGDAATPGNWPYQEKVFGWIEVPIQSQLTGNASYQGTIETYDPSSNTNVIRADAFELAMPGKSTFCTLGGNQCDPTLCSRSLYAGNCDPSTSDGTGPCTRSDYECWWHAPVSWCPPLLGCHTGTWEYNAGDSEPPAPSGDYYPLPTCSVSSNDIPPGTDVVDSQAAAVNLQGCTAGNENWSSSGSFSFSYGDPAVPGSQRTDMDVHQLGTGLGGHMWFTHTNEPTDANGVSLWGVTGTWTPTVSKGRYQVKVYLPAAGATATEADYAVSNGLGSRRVVTVNQNAYTDQWVRLGYFWLGPGSTVSLTNLHVSSNGDLAFSGMAFVPAAAGSYAMLGDSYSAGEGTGSGTYDANTDNYSTPQGVNNGHRSADSYNRVFAAGTTTFASPGSWVDVACSGALVPDFYSVNPNGKCPNEPGQQTALNASTSLVTLTFGGNDLGFGPIISDCVSVGASQWWNGTPLNELTTCEQKDSATFQTELAALTDPSSSGGLPQIFAAIRAAAPNAEVVVLGYPHLLIGTTADNSGRCIRDGWILNSDQDWLNSVGGQIDSAVQAAVTQAGFRYLSTTAAFTGHELCSSSPWLTGILDPNALDKLAGFDNYLSIVSPTVRQQFFHPNIAGYAYMAQLLAGALEVP